VARRPRMRAVSGWTPGTLFRTIAGGGKERSSTGRMAVTRTSLYVSILGPTTGIVGGGGGGLWWTRHWL